MRRGRRRGSGVSSSSTDRAPRDRPSWRFRVLAWLVIAFVRLARWRVRTRGLEHVPSTGGAVLTWNHTSHVDFVVTAYDIYRRLGRPVHVLARADLWRSWRTRWILRWAGAVPVERSDTRSRRASYAAAVKALTDGRLVMVAPEGRISTTFEVEPMRTGAARMARQARVPIVPSASWGSHRLVTTGRPFDLRRAWAIPVEVVFGEPIEVGPDADVAAVTALLHHHTSELLTELQRIYPDGAPKGAWWVPARLGGSAPPAGSAREVDADPASDDDAPPPGAAT